MQDEADRRPPAASSPRQGKRAPEKINAIS